MKGGEKKPKYKNLWYQKTGIVLVSLATIPVPKIPQITTQLQMQECAYRQYEVCKRRKLLCVGINPALQLCHRLTAELCLLWCRRKNAENYTPHILSLL